MRVKKGIIVLLLFHMVLVSALAQTRGVGVKKSDDTTVSTPSMEVPRIELEKDQICDVYAIAISPDGNHIAAGYINNLIRIWNAKTGTMEKVLEGHNGAIWSVAYSPDGKMLVSGSADRTVKCWDVETGKEIRTLSGHTKTVSYVTVSSKGTYIASGSTDKTVKFWDISNGELLQTLAGHTDTIAAISYSISDKYVASASWDKTVKVYNVMGGAERITLVGHTSKVFAVEFSPDETQIATGSADKTIKLWDRNSGKVIRTITGYNGEVWGVAYSPDGKYIAGAASDGSLKVWNTTTGTEDFKFTGHDKEIRSICYNREGTCIYTGDSGGIIKTWNAKTGELIATLLQCNDGEWVTWTPDGFLNGSNGALEKLSYTVNGQKYSLEEIKAVVQRPDVVEAAMSQTEKPNNITDNLAAIVAADMIPLVSLTIQNADGSERTDNTVRDIRPNIQVIDSGSGIGRVFVKLNGRLIEVSEGVDSVAGDTIAFTSKTPLSLRQGTNTISVIAYNKLNKKQKVSDEIEVNWEGNIQKSRLFILAAGIDSYDSDNIPDLSNCVADAAALIETGIQYAGDLYSDVFVKLMANSEVSRDNLITELDEFGKQIKPDDVFILFLSGHGITHTDKNYYYIPSDCIYETDDDIPEYGVSKWTIIKSLSSIMAENITVILDTCNSASFATTKPDEKEFASMNKEAIIERFGAMGGYDLISSCSSYQEAVDNYKGHGVFTYCLLDAVKGEADLNNDGQVTSSELATYVTDEVPFTSNREFGYKQEPQSSRPKFNYPMFGRLNPLEGQSLKEAAAIALLASELNITLEEASVRLRNPSLSDSSIVIMTPEQLAADSLDSPAPVVATETTDSTITISWNTVFGATGYSIYYTTDSERIFTILNMDKVEDIIIEPNDDTSSSLSNTNSYTATGLNPETVYYFRVVASKDTLVGANSALVTVKTKGKIIEPEISVKSNVVGGVLFKTGNKEKDHLFSPLFVPNIITLSIIHIQQEMIPGWQLHYDTPSAFFNKNILFGLQFELYMQEDKEKKKSNDLIFFMLYGGYYFKLSDYMFLDLKSGLGYSISGNLPFGFYGQTSANVAFICGEYVKVFFEYGLKYIFNQSWAGNFAIGCSIGCPKKEIKKFFTNNKGSK